MLNELVGERVLAVKRFHHCRFLDSQNIAIGDRGRRLHAERLTSKATLSQKLALTQYADRCFLASLRDDGEFHLAILDVKHSVARIPLREDCLFLRKKHKVSALADRGKEYVGVEIVLLLKGRVNDQRMQGIPARNRLKLKHRNSFSPKKWDASTTRLLADFLVLIFVSETRRT